MIVLIIILIIVIVVVGLVLVGMYNGLVKLKNRVESAWAQIDVQLKRRHDLIPNLVETVKGYATHERETFEEVTRARAAAQAAQGPQDQGQAENFLTQALGRLIAVSEAYPQLRATENFQQLQGQLADTENQIQNARRLYNESVMNYDNALQTVPTSIVAGWFGFHGREYFELDDPAAREAPKVNFSDPAPVAPPAEPQAPSA